MPPIRPRLAASGRGRAIGHTVVQSNPLRASMLCSRPGHGVFGPLLPSEQRGAPASPTAFPHLYVSGHPLYAVLGFVRRRVCRLGGHWLGLRLGRDRRKGNLSRPGLALRSTRATQAHTRTRLNTHTQSNTPTHVMQFSLLV